MKNTGDGRRKIRVEKEVQELISGFVIRQLRHDLPGLVTITRVMMPADFRAAQVYVTYFDAVENSDQKKINVADLLQSWAKDIQDEIAHTMKMRYCPRLTFFNDETTEKILKIEKLISEISNNPNASQISDIENEFDEDID